MKNIIILTLLTFLFTRLNGEKLLLVFPFAAKSHYFLGNELAKGLANLGNDVTIIAAFEEKKPPKNYRNIVVGEMKPDKIQRPNLFEMGSISPYFQLLFLVGSTLDVMTEFVLENTEVQDLLRSKEKFDAVIVEQFFNDAHKIFAHHFKAPLILFNPIGSSRWVNNLVANPQNPSYVVDALLSFSTPMTFYQRIYNLMYGICSDLIINIYHLPKQYRIMKKYYHGEMPEFENFRNNVSLVISNSHESIYEAVPHVPNMIDIGGFHITTPEKLPKDLQTFMDNAKDGVIYFSLGSNLNPSDMPKDKKDIILKVLGSRKEKILWKWNEDKLENKPDNVMISKWFPQHAILAHPNCKLFISHGGLLSTTETVYFGVPIIAFPVFGDQKLNAARAIAKGFAVKLEFPEIYEDTLSTALTELLENPKYRENAKRASNLLHDRPIEPIKLADFWIKYVVRHKGAPHLRVAAVGLPLYKYYMLDVFAVILSVCVLIIFILKKIYKLVFKKKNVQHEKYNNKSKKHKSKKFE
ncbi:hypothetical protein ABEB36_012962 [Hypothenemus hampei]|uniref:UDP-glucuronosyltransferase n=1 Tax=Hypothenemus hampei TaxID=57062 RepID=A0ABD1E6D5_HYPHA